MTQPNTLRRVAFPEAGEGCELLLRFPGFAALQNHYGAQWFNHCVEALLRMDTEVMNIVLAYGVTQNGEIKNDMSFATMDGRCTLDRLQTACLDAFTLGANGLTWEEHCNKVDEANKKAIEEAKRAGEAEAEAEANPTTAPAAGLDGSKSKPTASDSLL